MNYLQNIMNFFKINKLYVQLFRYVEIHTKE